jgi:hypothetical protein
MYLLMGCSGRLATVVDDHVTNSVPSRAAKDLAKGEWEQLVDKTRASIMAAGNGDGISGVYTSQVMHSAEGTTFEEFLVDVPNGLVLWRSGYAGGWVHNVGHIAAISPDRIIIGSYCADPLLMRASAVGDTPVLLDQYLCLGKVNGERFISPANRMHDVMDAANAQSSRLASVVCIRDSTSREHLWGMPWQVTVPGEYQSGLEPADRVGVVVSEDEDTRVPHSVPWVEVRRRTITIRWEGTVPGSVVAAGGSVFIPPSRDGDSEQRVRIAASGGAVSVGEITYIRGTTGDSGSTVGRQVHTRAAR